MEKNGNMIDDMQDNRPIRLPDAWPTDGLSKMSMKLGIGWVIQHRDRESMVYMAGKWKPLEKREEIA